MSPVTETCATLPRPAQGAFKPSFTGSFSFGHAGGWSAACNNATTEIPPGTSFELTITSPGSLATDSAGAHVLDARADAFPWTTSTQQIVDNSFHGTLNATLVGADGGEPLYVSLKF